MKRNFRHYWYSAALCLALLWALLTLVQPVYAGDVVDPGNATISGVVTDAQGHPVQDIYVASYLKTGEPDNPFLQPVGAVSTDSNGAYTITNLFSSTYQLSFEDTRLPPFYVTEFYNNAFAWKDAADILVGAGATVTGIDATIGVPGQISGTVTNGAGEPIAGLFVVPFPLPVSEGEQFNAAITDSSGRYTVTKIPPGTYGIYFEALPHLPYQSEYYNNVYNSSNAQGITVQVDTTTANIDAQLGKRGRIQGTVTDENGNLLPNINVSVTYSNTEGDFWQPLNNVTTAADGSYDVEAFSPGIYRLGFVDQRNPKRYTDEYYNDSATFESASDFSVTVDSVVSGINASLTAIDTPGAVISGTVTGTNANPLGLMHVLAYRIEDAMPESGNWPVAGDDFTNAQGRYKIIGLPPGTYRIEFCDDTLTPQFATEFYENALTIAQATNIPVTENAVVEHIDAQLGGRGSISGKVTDLAGNVPVPPESVYVMLSHDPTGAGNWNFLYGLHLNASATYSFPNLNPGVYHVGFSNASGYFAYNQEYYDNASDFSQATAIDVAPDTHLTGIDAHLGPQGRMYGKVTDSDGNPLENIPVNLYYFDLGINGGSWQQQGTLYSETDGVYRWGGLRYGAYRLHFAGSSAYVPEFYQDAATLEAATTVSLTKASPYLTDINAELANKGYLTGQVTNQASEPLTGIKVYLYGPQPDGAGGTFWNVITSGETDSAGQYKLFELPNGTVRLGFIDESSHYVSEYHENVTTLAEATDLQVTESTVITIDAQLAPFGRITGKVTTESDQPLAGISVLLHQETLLSDGSTTWTQYQSTTTDENGHYALEHLLGRYRVQFADQRTFPGEYQSEFYNDVSSLTSAADFIVTPGAVFPNTNAKLSEFGRIHGTVTDENGNPIQNIGVAVFSDPAQNGGWQTHLASGVTDSSGAYTLLGLEAGLYRLYFSDREFAHRYSGEYYDNASTLSSATTVTVTNANTTTVDIALAPTGGINGTVTDPNGNPLATVQVSLLTDQDGNGRWESGIYFTYPDVSGVYTFTGLDVGSYHVYFQDPSGRLYAPEFYSDSLTLDGATNVTVTAGIITPEINAQMGPYSHITGTVTGENGEPLPTPIRVSALQLYPDPLGYAYWYPVSAVDTDSEGRYNMSGLIAGAYRLQFHDPFNNYYHTEYYDDQGYPDHGLDIQVGVAMTLTEINAQLVPYEAMNFPPLARNDYVFVYEGGMTTTVGYHDPSFLVNDRDAEFMPMTVTLVTSPTHGMLMINGDGTFTYTHNADGAVIDYFTYKVNDGVFDSNVATVTVAITQTNDVPLAVADSYTLTAGSVLTGNNVLANDSDEESAVLTATLVTTPTHGALTLSATGLFTYTHDGSAPITDTFAYVASDGITVSHVATVSLSISPTTPVTPALSFTFSKTVGIEGILPLCTAKGEMKVPVGTAVVYCYMIHNTGSVTLTRHSLTDSDLGRILDNVAYTLTADASYSTTVTKSLTISITNVATWTATVDGAVDPNLRRAPGVVGASTTAATVLISGPTDDQDGDTIPDNLESWADPDHDNLPNFLDTDSDGDMLTDQAEVGDPAHPLDSDNDGIPDFLDNDLAGPALNLHLYLPVIYK